MPNTLFGPVTQLGYVVEDIEAAAQAWTDSTGVGPWTLMKNVTLSAVMNGQPTAFKIHVALTYQGDCQIELIQPLDNNPSPYNQHAKAGLWGAHHTQFTVDHMETAIEQGRAAGLEPACIIEAQGGGRYTYLRGASGWFELIEIGEGLAGLFGMIKAGCQDWDGQDPIRKFA